MRSFYDSKPMITNVKYRMVGLTGCLLNYYTISGNKDYRK